MIKRFFILFLSIIPGLISEKLNAQDAIVKGIVVDKETRIPIEYVSVALLRKTDSSVVAGILTRKNGSFSLDKLPVGMYALKLVALSYKPLFSSIQIVTGQKTVLMDTLKLELSNQILSEVVVSGKKNISVANRLDKQVYRADQFEASKGGTAIDVLKNLPAVSLNSAGEISVRGATGFLVLLNGKPVLADAQTILSQLPANTIENMEILTAPSSKYEADGRAGIVNITTRKGSTDGWEIQANVLGGLPSTTTYGNLERPKRYGGDITLNYRNKAWDFSLSANYNRNDANGMREGDVFTINEVNNTRTRFPSMGERSFDRYNYGVRAAIAFAPNKRNNFNLGFFASKKYQQRRADIFYNNASEDLSKGSIIRRFDYFNSNLQNKEGKFLLGSLDYTHSFDNGSKLSASAIYESADLYGNTINQNLDFATKSTLFQLVTNPYTNPISGYRLKIDYSVNLGKGKLEAGYQYRDDQQDGRFDYTVTPFTNQPDIDKFRGRAKSSNTINGMYLQYGAKQNKLQYIAGLRYEISKREVILSSDPNPHYLNLNNLFPSLSLLYTINNAWSYKAGYSKRIQRNNNFELNPIPEREHSETLEQGDPDLLPQFVDLVEMGINHNFRKGDFFATLYYQHIKNPIQRVNSVYADTILNRLFTNVDKARLIGFELGTSVKFNSWYSLYFGANIYNYKISGGLNVLGNRSTVSNANWVYSLNLNHSFNLGKNWNLQTGLNYLSARPTAQGEDSRFFNPSTTVKKTMMNGRLTVGMQWQNMNLGFLNANQQRITTWGKNFYTTTNYLYETDVLILTVNFSLNRLSSKPKLPTSEIGEREF